MPLALVEVPALPETWSGKFMRQLVQELAADGDITAARDTSGLRNPECLSSLRDALQGWEESIIPCAASHEKDSNHDADLFRHCCSDAADTAAVASGSCDESSTNLKQLLSLPFLLDLAMAAVVLLKACE
eukprot:TRINITY_DN98366_c0_g1_i1.p2 TRINITY_DN98366_c0_g1~~TRINITY_DN98366_c0_g1_i1.p2  ORF type:complete len:140 (-),score=37.91 TRINITY_DN98366_c0_g1_i1:16-405(-)